MESPSPFAKVLEKQQSIKNEPRTLFEEEMELAREAALEVINNTRKQALKIFLEGLEPIKISPLMPKWESLNFEEVNQEFC
ncbi:hypothetical protein SLEP1_g4550 [Rubroshorea leprosula]|uniref:Uncharacterized protein n=1 Tax=Rubroshorea leprosula TaxID=152421 RepID=A0AAV5HXX1_9ROSI|nr:hypothetical protein SLEP1_g4550 [Rubroshorea leprosula]